MGARGKKPPRCFKAMKRILVIFLAAFMFIPRHAAAEQPGRAAELIMFYSPGCRECIKAREQVMPEIEKEFRQRLDFVYLDVAEIENYKLFLRLAQESGSARALEVPVFYMRGKFLGGQSVSAPALRGFIGEGLKAASPGVPLEPADPLAHFKSFVPLSVAAAGLQDGVNPCAFTVIVFFISFLAAQGYRKRELFFVGSAFIFSVFLTYLAIGLGVFNFFYRFGSFWALTRAFNIAVGLASLIFGAMAVYDFLKFRKSGSTEQMLLQLPKPIKENIHKVIGFFYRRGKDRSGQGAVSLFRLLASAFISGFLVSLLEAVCTGQVYLPTIAFVLKSSPLKLQALTYLLLYNIMFIVPLAVIFALALAGVSSGQFAGFLKKHLGLIKIFMAVLFFALGIFLLWGV